MVTSLSRALIITVFAVSTAGAQDRYQVPPKELADLVDAPVTPSMSVNPAGTVALIGEQAGYLTIADLSQPELKLAGMRFNPENRTAGRAGYIKNLALLDLKTKVQRPVAGLPNNAHLRHTGWSPDSKTVAFTHSTPSKLELWVLDVTTATAKLATNVVLNNVRARPYQWMPDSQSLICAVVPEEAKEAPKSDPVPPGPVVQESVGGGKKAPVRTFQDLLKSEYDDQLFAYYTNTTLMKVRPATGAATKVYGPALVMSYDPSPDGQHLLVETTHAPFSHIVPVSLFLLKTEVTDLSGKPEVLVAELPAAEGLPPDRDAVRAGRRDITWRADVPATLFWAEAQDDGEPKKDVPMHDKVYLAEPPYTAPRLLASLPLRFQDVEWGTNDLCLVTEEWYKTRKTRTYRVAPSAPSEKPEVVFDRSTEDRYANPGSPAHKTLPNGQSVMLTDAAGKSLYFVGMGASPEGDRPFVDRFDIATKKAERLWRSETPYFELPFRVLDEAGSTILTQRESVTEPRNVFRRVLANKDPEPLTSFPHPAPQMKDVKKELIKYKRADGVDLTGLLFLPPGYTAGKDKPLPVLMWAYPAEFKSAALAGQVSDSPYRFVGPSIQGPVLFTLRGYAVLDDPQFPIVGEGKNEPNDTYVKQLTMGAQAAVDELVRRGVGDPQRMSIGGHSYGAFTTANLLAHTDLFRAGIARSGAYNRTLTPFGFQSEERTFWEARDTYVTMSPFTVADKVDEPLLMIHGMEDANPGTFPIQSERFFHALKGLGGTSRLVMLPKESHGYAARESLKHMLYEMDRWLEQHVKNAGPRAARVVASPAPSPSPAASPAK